MHFTFPIFLSSLRDRMFCFSYLVVSLLPLITDIWVIDFHHILRGKCNVFPKSHHEDCPISRPSLKYIRKWPCPRFLGSLNYKKSTQCLKELHLISPSFHLDSVITPLLSRSPSLSTKIGTVWPLEVKRILVQRQFSSGFYSRAKGRVQGRWTCVSPGDQIHPKSWGCSILKYLFLEGQIRLRAMLNNPRRQTQITLKKLKHGTRREQEREKKTVIFSKESYFTFKRDCTESSKSRNSISKIWNLHGISSKHFLAGVFSESRS